MSCADTYAALPPLGKLRLREELPGQVCLGVVALFLALGLQFYFELKVLAPAALQPMLDAFPFDQDAEAPFTNQDASFLVVAFWAVLATIAHLRSRPSAAKLPPLKSVVERLHDENRHLESKWQRARETSWKQYPGRSYFIAWVSEVAHDGRRGF